MKENSVIDEKKVDDGTEVHADNACDEVEIVRVETPHTRKEETHANKMRQNVRIKRKLSSVGHRLGSTYAKRNIVTNVVLSLYMFLTFSLSGLIGCSLLDYLITETFLDESSALAHSLPIFCGIVSSISIVLIVCMLAIKWTFLFVVCNRKEAVYRSLACTSIVTSVFLAFYMMFLSNDESEFIFGTLFFSVVVAVLIFLFVRLSMLFKKYGATAWMLLDVPRSEERKKKVSKNSFYIIIGAITIGILAICICAGKRYVKRMLSDYKSAASAQIGDYFYKDGTVSSKYLTDKECVGVVFSLETTQYEKARGYHNGHIVALSDNTEKCKWADVLDNVTALPDYRWQNRTTALTDMNGLQYKSLTDSLDLRVSYFGHQPDESYETSRWYVPTAGEWTAILKNIGGVEPDSNLQFDAKVAEKNLEKIKLNPRQWYWTFTEQDDEHVWSIRIASGEFGSRTAKSSKAFVRCIAAF